MRVRLMVAAALLTVPAAAPPIEAYTPTRCVASFPADATVAVQEIGPAGTALHCSPNLGCVGCSFYIEMSIGGIGVVGAEITGSQFDRVTCGPAPRSCRADSPVFVFLQGDSVRCSSRTTLAVRVEMICEPHVVG